MDDIRAELRKIPPVTRFMVLSSAAVSLPVMMHILSGYKVVYTPGLVFGKAQIWRIWTSWFLGLVNAASGVPFIFDMLMLYRASNELEEALFGGHSADYAWHLLVSGAAIMEHLSSSVPSYTFSFTAQHGPIQKLKSPFLDSFPSKISISPL
ncbi:unnamed protein product [Rhizoctonia solani]|uniref:Derlin n=1 Tax=Rhizoctonia solani TaxID=456999 RepID=A0A8H3BLM5_9AGAM|nr:unnamed protein product [Rhizoctonia solani]